MIKKFFAAVILLLVLATAVFLIVAMRQPDDYTVTRTITTSNSAGDIYAKVIDLKRWSEWSPWAHRDPEMLVEYSTPSFGVGAYSTWSSKTEGKGKQTIVEAILNEKIELNLEFFEPFPSQANVQFVFEVLTSDDGTSITKVSWIMYAKNQNLLHKFVYAIFDLDEMIGKDFEAGLAKMVR